MDTRPIRRVQRPRSALLTLTCGCLAALILLVMIVVGVALFLPQIAFRVIGLNAQGETAAVFAQVTPQPTVELLNPTEPQQVTVNLGQYGGETINNDSPQLYTFTVGTGSGGGQMVQAAFTENGLMQICQQRSTVCGSNSTDPRFHNARIDLRPGGAVIYLDTTLPQLGNVPLTAGAVVRWDANARRVVVDGVDLGGTLYSPSTQSLSELVTNVEQQMNDLIQQMSVEAGGGLYTLSEVRIDDTTLTLVLR